MSWFDDESIPHLLNRRLHKLENLMTQLTTDVATLTANVATLVTAVDAAIARGGPVDTSAEVAAIEAANAVIAEQVAKLTPVVAPPAV